jgi:hypothetical protein
VPAEPVLFDAAAQDGAWEIVARHSGMCLEVSGASPTPSAPVVQWTCAARASQRWAIEPLADGYFRILARHSGLALHTASIDDAAPVTQQAFDGSHQQQWYMQSVGDGYYLIVSRHSEKVLDVSRKSTTDGGQVIQYSYNGGINQHWLLRAAPEPPPGPPPPPPPVEPPPPPVEPPPGGPSTADIVRFLEQATFGPTPELIEHVRRVGFEGFLEEQFGAPVSSYSTLPLFPTARDNTTCPNGSACQRDNYTMYPLQNQFFVNALYGQDQLRQRVAFALHQIIVVSGVEITQPSWMAPYLQILDRHAFGNYRQLLYDITRNPAMGNYLDVNGNTRTRPNENYAREILQLFSIGTVRVNPDGTPQLDAAGNPIPTYTQETVNEFARVFTGWRFAPAPAPGVANYLEPMVANEAQHDTREKTLLRGVVLPAGQNAEKDLNDALDNIFEDPNIGPFISRQLIQHLVTSNPSPRYVERVASVFNGSTGTRGDLRAVVRAILLDPEARGDSKPDPTYGRLRHPAQFITSILRAFGARSADGAGLSDGYLNPQSSPMGMDVFRPGSVFSYFSPATVVAGTAGVRGPEFGLLSTSTAVRRANFVNTMIFSRIATSANAPAGTSIDLSSYASLASDPVELVNTFDRLLLHGTMSPQMRDTIVGAVQAVSAANSLKRARTAAYLILTSSQYQVER